VAYEEMICRLFLFIFLIAFHSSWAVDELSADSFYTEISEAQSAAQKNDPKASLLHYQQALALAKKQQNPTLIRVASFGIGRMQIWLGNLIESRKMYIFLLTTNLTDDDRKFAINQLTKIDQLEALEQKKQIHLKEQKIVSETKNEISAAQSAAEKNNPKTSLLHYQQALALARKQKKTTLIRIASFGIGKMQIWLGDFTQARQVYNFLLTTNLSDVDRQLARNQLTKIDRLEIFERQRQIRLRKQRILTNAKTALYKNRIAEAFAILDTYPNKTKYSYLMAIGLTYAFDSSPRRSLDYFMRAYQIAASDGEKRAALFQIGKMQLWLERYSDSLATFDTLLEMPLDELDYEIAFSGRIRSLNNQDYPMNAYESIPKNFKYTQPIMVIAGAQAADWADWPYISTNLLIDNAEVLDELPPDSYLWRLVKQIDWDNRIRTARNDIGISRYNEQDTDNFKFNRSTIHYNRRFVPRSATTFAYTKANYERLQQKRDGDVFRLTHRWYTDHFRFALSSGVVNFSRIAENDATIFPSWHPLVWFAGVEYRPSSVLWVSVFNTEEYVESINSLFNQITFNSTDINVLLHPFPRLFLGGSYFQQRFSDRNNRNGAFLRVMGVVSWRLGLLVEARSRFYRNSQPRSNNYFSPEKLNETIFMLRLRRKLSPTWRVYAEGGFGKQFLLPEAGEERLTSSISLFEIGVQGELLPDLMLQAFYGRSDLAIETAAGFARDFFGVRLIYFFDDFIGKSGMEARQWFRSFQDRDPVALRSSEDRWVGPWPDIADDEFYDD
jgi:hypothetical protein